MYNLLKYLPRLFYYRGNPLQFIFFITSRCNLKCKHCFYAEKLNKTKNELTIEEIEKISKGIKNLIWFSITGGEPFLRDDIVQIADIFYRNNKFNFLTIPTNGILQSSIVRAVSEICKKCKKARIILYFSIDGLEETHNKIRSTPDGFKKVIETIQEVKKLKKEFKNLSIATITTCNAENQKEIKNLAIFLKDEVKPDTITVNMLRGKPCSGALGKLDLKYYFDFVRVQEEAWSRGDLHYFDFFGKTFIQKKESLQKKIISTVFSENRYIIPCRAGNISCVMTETGDLYPCEILNKKIGNIREVNCNFDKLWYSVRAEEIRRFIKDSKCFCTYECAITTNIFFNITQLIKMFVGK